MDIWTQYKNIHASITGNGPTTDELDYIESIEAYENAIKTHVPERPDVRCRPRHYILVDTREGGPIAEWYAALPCQIMNSQFFNGQDYTWVRG